MEQKLITVGKIVNTQGHLGEVRAIPLTDFPERFKKMKHALLTKDGKSIELSFETVRSHKQFIIIKFEEIADMNEAEKLKDYEIQIPEAELMQLEQGQYYVFQLIGLEVYNSQGHHLGQLKEVFQTGANDVYLIKSDSGEEILVPAIKDVIKEINIEEKRIVADPWEIYE